MAVTPATFRQQFAEFSDAGIYTDQVITIWIGVALNLLNADRWGGTLDYGTSLFIAHHLVLGQRNALTVAAGGVPGKLKGPVSAQSADKVSSSYDTQAISLTDMGFWGLSEYGLRFFQLSMAMGAGGMQLGCSSGTWPGLV